MAQRIVDLFGDDTFEIMDNQPHRLPFEVEGIGKKKQEKIIESFQSKVRLRSIIVALGGIRHISKHSHEALQGFWRADAWNNKVKPL